MRHSQLSNEQVLLVPFPKATTLSLRSQDIRFFLRAPLDFQKKNRAK
jgi:hypothetical protein